ncbi:hypothetical protein [Rhizobacter sp. Root404]|uniref:hypothetical protein n=1 Tax=Rhizobacter sp. Root404 TaxID=1736528 RepID=UPI0006F5B14C|nr:hypothetical protein [Rhizobacter sp. Root404]KQW38298.1 hypothetical protein ASC76_09720 [Rhizobacter sp. Root404]
MSTRHQPTAAVRESFGQAQQQAAAMVAGPPTPWNEAARAPRGSARWLGIAAVSVAAAGVGGWLAADWLKSPAPAVPSVPPSAAAPPPRPTPAPAVSVAPQVEVPIALRVTRQSGVVRIEATNARLADAVRALAQATHTNVKGGEALGAIASPVTLNWQGTDVAAAWDALLGRYASIGVSCTGAACELWVVGVTPSPATTRAASAALGMAAVAEGPATPEPAQAPRPAARVEPPPPATDENTETN